MSWRSDEEEDETFDIEGNLGFDEKTWVVFKSNALNCDEIELIRLFRLSLVVIVNPGVDRSVIGGRFCSARSIIKIFFMNYYKQKSNGSHMYLYHIDF